MEREGALHPGGMRAVVGLGIAEVEACWPGFPAQGVAVVANHNTASQIVLSGDMAGLDAVGAQCAPRAAKVIPLKVSVANHSPLVAGAVDDLPPIWRHHLSIRPRCRCCSTSPVLRAAARPTIKAIMARQIASRVRWLPIVEQMVAEGVEVIVELGPKNVLTGMMKKILPKNSAITCLQADSPEVPGQGGRGADCVITARTTMFFFSLDKKGHVGY
jgi:[acyl-carrier-protein] S-malonyltransferase